MVTDIAWNGMMDAVAQVAVETFLALSGLSPPRYGINLRNVWLSALLPGQTIEPHQDEQPPEWRERFHVPIVTNADAYFIQDGAAHVMTVGRVWRVDPRRRHAVWNAGQTPRVHLMFDRYGT